MVVFAKHTVIRLQGDIAVRKRAAALGQGLLGSIAANAGLPRVAGSARRKLLLPRCGREAAWAVGCF
jgi:hypothetical protein